MQNVLLVIHMIACLALVIAVLLQRSEGGALGMGGGGTGGLISGRGASSLLVKVTMGLAATFIVTSVVMTRLNAEIAIAPTDVERQLQDSGATNPFDPLAPGTPPAATTTPAPAATPTPAPVDPLSPTVTPPAPRTTTPATTPAAPAPSTATTTPTTPPASAPATAPSATAPPATETPVTPPN